MKRLLSLIALLLAALCACACAADAGSSGTIDLSGLSVPDHQFYKSVPKKLLDDDDFIPNADIDPAALVTRDAVTIDPDLRLYRVVTPEGITLTYTAPEGPITGTFHTGGASVDTFEQLLRTAGIDI